MLNISYKWIMIFLGMFSFIFLLFGKDSFGYDPIQHSDIAKEALNSWREIPSETRDHAKSANSPNDSSISCDEGEKDSLGYNSGDDILTGAQDEDNVTSAVPWWCPPQNCGDTNEGLNGFFEHFWDPDDPAAEGYNCGAIGGGYNKGLSTVKAEGGLSPPSGAEYFDSAYRLAQYYWDWKSIPYYTGKYPDGQRASVDKDRAYYWLGRIIHLLEDMTVPAHVHDIPHDPFIGSTVPYIGKVDPYEEYFKNNPQLISERYKGNNYLGYEYKYDNLLTNRTDFKWEWVHGNPTPLFKLFYYTAQKTQYFASGGGQIEAVGNGYYVKLDGNAKMFDPILWASDNIEPWGNPNLGDPKIYVNNIDRVADALIPHAMKAVAGLYQLFWVETHLGFGPDVLDSIRQSFLAVYKGPSIMGVPLVYSPDVHRWGNGYAQDFDGGTDGKGALMLSDSTNTAYWVHGSIWSKYESLGGATAFLGYPLSDEIEGIQSSITGAKIKYNRFEGGSIYHHATGPRIGLIIQLGHGIVNKWTELGLGNSLLGAPISDERNATISPKGTIGKVVDFEKGHIHWHGSGLQYNKAYETHGAIDSLYVSLGGTGSWLGFPITDEYKAATGYSRSDFEGGYITTTDDVSFKAYQLPSTQSPTICLDQTNFVFTADENGANPSSQTLNVWNCGGGTLSWSASTNANWLSLNPTSDNSTGEKDPANISVNINGLSSNIYSAIVTISGIGATNAPQTASVTLIVSPEHILTITNQATGLPNPITPRGTANLNVTAEDSLGHGLSYSWVASCTTLDSSGNFSGSATQKPTWIAPQNSTGSEQACTITLTVTDGYGLSQQSSYIQKVNPGGVTSLTIIDGIRLVEPPPYNINGNGTVEAKIKNIGSANVILDRIQAVGEFRDKWGDIYERFWPAEQFLPAKSFSPGDTYSYNKPLEGWVFPGLASTATVMIYVKFYNIPGQFPITNFESGATAQFSFEVGHTLEITAKASGNPNPINSEGFVTLGVSANDSLGHGLSYQWTANCPAGLEGHGQFSSTTIRTPTWTAPRNSTRSQQACTIEVTINDGHDLNEVSSFLQGVKSPIGDINGDGNVNLQDAILALQAVSRVTPSEIRPDYARSGADVDGDDKIGLAEILYILQVTAELRSAEPGTIQFIGSAWPMFQHDPQHTGYSAGNSISLPLTQRWTYTSSPVIVEGVLYNGVITSSPVIAEGAVYFGSAGQINAIDATQGTVKWTYDTDPSIWSAAAVSGSKIYIVGSSRINWNNVLYSLNVSDGKEIWKVHLGSSGSGTSSPVVFDGVVYVGSGGSLSGSCLEEGHKVYAISAENGDVLWGAPIVDSNECRKDVLSSPAVTQNIVVVGTWGSCLVCPTLFAFDRSTGVFKWSAIVDTPYIFPAPSTTNGLVYVRSGGAGWYGELIAFDEQTGTEVWRSGVGAFYNEGSPAIADGVVYTASGFQIHALDASTGAPIWTVPATSAGTCAYGAFIRYPFFAVANGLVFIKSGNECDVAKVYAVNTSDGSLLWDSGDLGDNGALGGADRSTPAVASGWLYFGIGNILYAYGH